MSSHKSQLRWREWVADGTMAFAFAKPPGFTHQAGQSVLLTLPDPPETDSTGNSRTFTIASAPYEPELLIATRLRDTAFKRVLQSMPLGTNVRLEGPAGEMLLDDDDGRPVVLLAGGIGITPFLAMARHATQAGLTHQITLFYANRRPEDAAFLAELTGMTTVNPKLHLIAIMSDAQKSAQTWAGESGHINRELLVRHLPDLFSPLYYFAGPPAMTMAMQEMLAGIGIAEADMRYEAFYGY